MTKLMKTIQITGASAAMMAMTALPAFAWNNVNIEIKNNGAGSHNMASVYIGQGSLANSMCSRFKFRIPRFCQQESGGIVQETSTSSTTAVNLNVNTGGNSITGIVQNGKGDDVVKNVTGDVTVDVNVKNVGGSNYIGL